MTTTRRIFLVALPALALALLAMPAQRAWSQTSGPVVFAAASLKNALDEAAAGWAKAGHPAPRISYAASNTLAKQIEQGAPADIFFSADLDWMDYAQSKGLVRPATRVSLLANAIVLVAPKDSATSIAIRPGFDLAAALGNGRLAMGSIDSVPAGKYGHAALETLGAWNAVKDKVAQADSVRSALLLVSRGEAPLGIVYATDAAADPNVKVVGTFPSDSHPPIVYPVAQTTDATSPDAASLLEFLRSAPARSAFERQGFTVLAKSTSGS